MLFAAEQREIDPHGLHFTNIAESEYSAHSMPGAIARQV